MQNHSTVLDQITWGIHLNFEGHFASPPPPLSWLTQLQQQDWQRRGVVLWDADLHLVAHLYAGYALELLEHLQGNDTWKTEGLVIGSPAFQLSSNSTNTPSTKLGGELVLKKPNRAWRRSSTNPCWISLSAGELVETYFIVRQRNCETSPKQGLSAYCWLRKKSTGKKRGQRTDWKQRTKNHTHLDPTRQVFHGLSGCSDLQRHIKTGQSMDSQR